MAEVIAGSRSVPIPGSLELRHNRMDPTGVGIGFIETAVGTIDTGASGLEQRLDKKAVNPAVTRVSHYLLDDLHVLGYNRTARRFVFGATAGTVLVDAAGNQVESIPDEQSVVEGLDITDTLLKRELGLNKTWVDVDYVPSGEPIGVIDLDRCRDYVGGSFAAGSSPVKVSVTSIRRARNFLGMKSDHIYVVRGSFYYRDASGAQSIPFRDNELTVDHLKFDRDFAEDYGLDGFSRRKVKKVVAKPAVGAAHNPPKNRSRVKTALALGFIGLVAATVSTVAYYNMRPPSRVIEYEKFKLAQELKQKGDYGNAARLAHEAHQAMPWYRRWLYGVPGVESRYERFQGEVYAERARAEAAAHAAQHPAQPVDLTGKAPGKAPSTKAARQRVHAPQAHAASAQGAGHRVSNEPFLQDRTLEDGRVLFRTNGNPAQGDSPSTVSASFDLWDQGNGDVYANTGYRNIVDPRTLEPVDRLLADRPAHVVARRRDATAQSAQAQPAPAAHAPAAAEEGEMTPATPFRRGDPLLAAYGDLMRTTVADYERTHGDVHGTARFRYGVSANATVYNVSADRVTGDSNARDLAGVLARVLEGKHLSRVSPDAVTRHLVSERVVRDGIYTHSFTINFD